MRVMERRFVIWTPPDVPQERLRRVAGAGGVNAGAPPAALEQAQEQGQGRAEHRSMPVDEAAGGSQQGEDGAGISSAGAGSAWDRGLAGIWREFCRRLEVGQGQASGLCLNAPAHGHGGLQ